jgi:hypothetical protein
MATARAGEGISSGKLEVEGRWWSMCERGSLSCPTRHRGGARSGFGLFGLSSEGVLDMSIRTSEVSVDSVDVMLVFLDEESLAVEPESRGICPFPAPKDLARAVIASAELLLLEKLDMILENNRRRLLDSEDEIEEWS